MQVGQLRAGVAEVDIKPPLGLAMGDGAPWATGYRYPLACKALVLVNGNDALVIVTLDAMGIDRADAIRASELASARTGIPASAITITCSHTHVAPSMLPTLHTYRQAFNPEFDDAAKARERAWVDHIVETIATVVCDAHSRLESASVGVTTTEMPWLVFNRRRHTRNHGVWTYWMGIPQDQAFSAEGPIDPEFGLVVVRGANHQPLALMWNMTGHNSFSFGDHYSGDLTYTVQAALDERLGVHIPCLYTPGCSGDTNYLDYDRPEGLGKVTDGIASAIVAIYREACTLPDVKLGSRKAELLFAQRDFTRGWWQHDIETKMPSWKEYAPKEVERFQREAEESVTYATDIVVQRIGETAFVSLPGEMFVEFGLMIKERSPFRHTYVAIYANDYAGYVTTK